MRTAFIVLGCCIAAGLAITGCASSAPAEYFTLDMRPSGAPAAPMNIEVGMISITEPLVQSNLLIKKSPTQVERYAMHQWAGGLDEMLKEKLANEFGPRAASDRTLTLTGDLLAFEQVDVADGAEAHVKLAAELREAGKSRYTPALLKKTYDISVPAKAPEANEAVIALSRAVEQLAAQIVADASKL